MRPLLAALVVGLLLGACSDGDAATSSACPVRLGSETFDFTCAVPETAVEISYSDLPDRAQAIENDSPEARWYEISNYSVGIQPTMTYLKLTPEGSPLALTFGDCWVPKFVYPDEQAYWTEVCN